MHVIIARQHAVLQYLVAEICDGIFKEMAFGRLELQVVLRKAIKDSLQPYEMVLLLPTMKAVYCWDSSDIFTCQNPLLRSMHEKIHAPTRDSMVS